MKKRESKRIVGYRSSTLETIFESKFSMITLEIPIVHLRMSTIFSVLATQKISNQSYQMDELFLVQSILSSINSVDIYKF